MLLPSPPQMGSCCARGERRIVRLGTVPVSILKI
ncbi:hypothetical protein AB7M22_001261 [Pseudomonas sp. ADAK2 TE3594]